jgi:hypothetical protein
MTGILYLDISQIAVEIPESLKGLATSSFGGYAIRCVVLEVSPHK